jgi:hypothetical protein
LRGVRARLSLVLSLVAAAAITSVAAGQAPRTATGAAVVKGHFAFAFDDRGVSLIRDPQDPFGATLTGREGRGGRAGQPPAGAPVLGLTLNYKTTGAATWASLPRGAARAAADGGGVTYTTASNTAPLLVNETYSTDGTVLDWNIELAARGQAVHVGDVGINIPAQGTNGATPADIFERGFLKHQFVSGAGSFFFYTRASGAPPFLLVTVKPGTHLEYQAGAQVFVHSEKTGGEETRGTWRQPHTGLDLKPGARVTYGFRMQWANSYDEMRQLLYDAGLFDVRVVPGMTVPSDLTAQFSLHTKARVQSVTAEFPSETTITPAASSPADTRVYTVAFRKLGENMLTITHDDGRKTYLEFFATEPMETLIKKRAAFLVNRQQVKDPSKWWDGVYGIYDMKAKKVRTMDDPDIFLDRMVYALTCDDPGLSKAPFIAAKNVTFPDKQEIASLEYYIEHFVWGGLQRKDDERPYPYGIYGTPNWYINRDPQRRKDYADALANGSTAKADLGKEHVWRNYDYPHVIMLYFHMYQIAKMYPEMTSYLDAAGYLTRAMETAKAFYTYPYEIYPSYYDTYKWGLYNELIVLDLIDALKAEGHPEQAKYLTGEWEKKVKYFVYDDPYPFRSEYAFDRTAFESTYAFAKYGATHEMAPDENLWFDLKLKKWWSHPSVREADSRAFMDRQLASGLVVRGWLNPAYYTLGADPGVSYMAAMGGWGVLDYGVNFAPDPYPWLQLGYASYLSSWALMNTGTAANNYGAWFPGKENDGASGWQFMSSKAGSAWMGSSFPGGVTEPRGPWHYDGEIDLGYGGALRMAATIVTNDPTFGWIAYGGVIKSDDGRSTNSGAGATLAINPRDGIRRRFDVLIQDPGLPFKDSLKRLKLELDRDGFAAAQDIVIAKNLTSIAFTVENRTGAVHTTTLKLALPANGHYTLTVDGQAVDFRRVDDADYPWVAEIAVATGGARVVLRQTIS